MASESDNELSKLRAEVAELKRSLNLFVRSQASLVVALRSAEESAQARHRQVMNEVGSLRALALADSSSTDSERVIVTDDVQALKPKSKSKGEVTGSFKVGDVDVQVSGQHEHIKELAVRGARWLMVLLGMALTGGIGWLIGVLRQLGEHQK